MTAAAWSLLAIAFLTATFAADELAARTADMRWATTCYVALAIGALCTIAAVTVAL